ncbi:MAG: hypothetical protein SGJ15_10600 [Bacteroidota bacterium]|nr:hypothetical protein [Bacteroidota bacterium]
MKNILVFFILILLVSCQEELGETFRGVGYDHTSAQKFDKEVIDQVGVLDSLKNFLVENCDTIVSFTYKDLDLSQVFTRVGEEPLTIENFSCTSFGSYFCSFETPRLPEYLIPKFKAHLAKLDTSKLRIVSLCKDKDTDFVIKEEFINDSVLMIHSISFYPEKPKNKEYYFKFHKDTFLGKNVQYRVFQTFNYKSPQFEKSSQ